MLRFEMRRHSFRRNVNLPQLNVDFVPIKAAASTQSKRVLGKGGS